MRGVKFFANDIEGSTIKTNRLSEANIEFVHNESGEVKIGLKAVTGNTYRWMGIGYVELYKLSPIKEATLADNDQNAPKAGAYTTINYDRNVVRAELAKLNRQVDQTSQRLDLCLVTSNVDYVPPFDVNASFAEAFEAFCETAGA